MMDVEPLIRAELSRIVAPARTVQDWEDVVARAQPRQRLWPRRPAVAVLVASLAVVLAAAALAAKLSGFEAWLRGAPGEPAPVEAQDRFRAANGRSWAAFPTTTELRELIRTEVGGREYVLWGFVSGDSLCLKLAAEVAFQPQACAPRSALARTSAPIVAVLPEYTFFDRAARPTALISFGIAADGVRAVTVEAIDGRHRALLGGNAFLFIQDRPNWGNRVLRLTALDAGVERTTIALPDAWPFVASARLPGGPIGAEASLADPRIGWLERSEKRGFPGPGGIRLIKPDPLSDLAVGLSGGCLSAVDASGQLAAQSCGFPRRALNAMISCRLCGAFMELRGIAADGVARVTAFTADQARLTLPLKHNAFTARIGRTQFPIRLVGYDSRGRVVATQLWPAQPGFNERPPLPAQRLRPAAIVRAPNGAVGTLHVGPRVAGFDCWRVEFSQGPSRGGCVAPYSGSRFSLDLLQPVARDIFLAGRVSTDVTRVELRFGDGTRTSTTPTRRHFLLAIPANQLHEQRTRAFVVTLDANGRVRARQRIFFRMQP
jgi:hypothetical protein